MSVFIALAMDHGRKMQKRCSAILERWKHDSVHCCLFYQKGMLKSDLSHFSGASVEESLFTTPMQECCLDLGVKGKST